MTPDILSFVIKLGIFCVSVPIIYVIYRPLKMYFDRKEKETLISFFELFSQELNTIVKENTNEQKMAEVIKHVLDDKNVNHIIIDKQIFVHIDHVKESLEYIEAIIKEFYNYYKKENMNDLYIGTVDTDNILSSDHIPRKRKTDKQIGNMYDENPR